jgi:hypothetical protein
LFYLREKKKKKKKCNKKESRPQEADYFFLSMTVDRGKKKSTRSRVGESGIHTAIGASAELHFYPIVVYILKLHMYYILSTSGCRDNGRV